jgi:hypothetical protein
LGDFLFRYRCIAALDGVPSAPKINSTSSLSTIADLFSRFGRAVAVVVGNKLDFPPVYVPFVVDLPEKRLPAFYR